MSTHSRLALQVDWRGYSAGREANAHRVDDIVVSVGAGGIWNPWDGWSLSIDALEGNHFVLYRRAKPGADADKTKDADDFSAPGLDLLGWLRFAPVSFLFVRMGAGLSLVLSDVEKQQSFYFIPEFLVEAGWIL